MKRLNLKRRTEGKTDYKKRLALLKSGHPRLVVRKSSGNVTAQLVEYRPGGDSVLVTVGLRALRELGWKAGANTPAAYLVGRLAGKAALGAGVKEAVLDTGRHPASEKLMAVVKGAVDAGLRVPHSEEALPAEERIKGGHIDAYMGEAGGGQFSRYKKEGLSVAKNFEEVLSKVEGD